MSITPPFPPVDLLGSTGELSAGRERSTADAVQQFEAVFVSLVLKQMRQSLSGEGLIPGDSGDIVGGLFDQYLGQHISDSGGFGLAESLLRSLEPDHRRSQQATFTRPSSNPGSW
jgi:Rod binding domain-containing protein